MKMKTQTDLRNIEIGLLYMSIISSIVLAGNQNAEGFQQIVEFLETNKIDINTINNILGTTFIMDYSTKNYTQKLARDYKELKKLYKEILKNVSMLYKDFGFINPISIYTAYVYMYKKGYLSYNKQFIYGTDTKDFVQLLGIDVIRGEGVCRSISNMLKDIYRELGMSSYNMSVRTDLETIKHLNQLYSQEEQQTKDSRNLIKIALLLTKYIPFSNHTITMVEENGINYILDPTNDGFLCKDKGKKILVANDPNYFMIDNTLNLTTQWLNLAGVNSDGMNIFKKHKQLNLPTISNEEFEQRYQQALRICIENQDMFEQFYHDNQEYIDSIYSISKNQYNMFERTVPFYAPIYSLVKHI